MVLFSLVDGFLEAHGIYSHLTINKDKLLLFLDEVETMYGPRPYHNLDHVVEVVKTAIALWSDLGLGDIVKSANPREHDVLALSFVVAAAVHDVGHLGLTNDFLIRSHHPYAINSNDISPNESHHSAATFRLLLAANGKFDFLESVGKEKFWTFRQQVIGLVMHTDMTKHDMVVSNLRSRNYSTTTSGELTVLMQATLKYADISHTCLPHPEHCVWVRRLQREVMEEGDRWLEKGWQPPSSMDRRGGVDLASSQLAFLKSIVIPFLEALIDTMPRTSVLLEAAHDNAARWRRKSMDFTS